MLLNERNYAGNVLFRGCFPRLEKYCRYLSDNAHYDLPRCITKFSCPDPILRTARKVGDWLLKLRSKCVISWHVRVRICIYRISCPGWLLSSWHGLEMPVLFHISWFNTGWYPPNNLQNTIHHYKMVVLYVLWFHENIRKGTGIPTMDNSQKNAGKTGKCIFEHSKRPDFTHFDLNLEIQSRSGLSTVRNLGSWQRNQVAHY